MRSFRQLIETVTADLAVNAEIEKGLEGLDAEAKNMALDGMELLYLAGANGISAADWISQMKMMWPTDEAKLRQMFTLLKDAFPQFIRHTGDTYVFHARTTDANAPVDTTSDVGQLAQQQIRLTAIIMQTCQHLGRFTVQDVLNSVAHQTHEPPAVLRMLIDHVLNSNVGVIKSEGQGLYRYEQAVVKSGMGFWRDLEGYEPPKD
jgi:hypothetical protein